MQRPLTAFAFLFAFFQGNLGNNCSNSDKYVYSAFTEMLHIYPARTVTTLTIKILQHLETQPKHCKLQKVDQPGRDILTNIDKSCQPWRHLAVYPNPDFFRMCTCRSVWCMVYYIRGFLLAVMYQIVIDQKMEAQFA